MTNFKHYASADGFYFGEIQGVAPEGLDVFEVPSAPEPEQSPAVWDQKAQAWQVADAPQPTQADYRQAIQAHLDAEAQTRSYDSAQSAASYASSTNTVWKAEAEAVIAWRDAVWVYAYAELAKVQAGERERPSVEELIAELPDIVWPE